MIEFNQTNSDHHRLQRYLAGYYREKKRGKVHLHIQFTRDVPCAFCIKSERFMSSYNHCAIYVDYFGAARIEERKRFSLSGIYAEMKDILENLIKEAQSAGEIDEQFDPSAVAELLISVYDGIVLHKIFDDQRVAMDLIRQTAMTLITQGVLKGRSE